MYSITMKCRPEALVQAGVEDLHDVGVHQARGGLRLALEARDERGIVGEVLGEQLDRDLALQAQVEREVHGGHPAEAEPALQAVAPGDLHLAHLPLFLGAAAQDALVPAPPPLALPAPLSPPMPVPPPGPLDAPGALSLPGAGVPPPGWWLSAWSVWSSSGWWSFRCGWSSWSWVSSGRAGGRRGGCGRRASRSSAGAAARTARARVRAGWRCPG